MQTTLNCIYASRGESCRVVKIRCSASSNAFSAHTRRHRSPVGTGRQKSCGRLFDQLIDVFWKAVVPALYIAGMAPQVFAESRFVFRQTIAFQWSSLAASSPCSTSTKLSFLAKLRSTSLHVSHNKTLRSRRCVIQPIPQILRSTLRPIHCRFLSDCRYASVCPTSTIC